MSAVAERLAAVRERVARACATAGRDPAEVELIAVSKLQPEALIREAYAAGQRAFGENYAQELRDKSQHLADLPPQPVYDQKRLATEGRPRAA